MLLNLMLNKKKTLISNLKFINLIFQFLIVVYVYFYFIILFF